MLYTNLSNIIHVVYTPNHCMHHRLKALSHNLYFILYLFIIKMVINKQNKNKFAAANEAIYSEILKGLLPHRAIVITKKSK